MIRKRTLFDTLDLFAEKNAYYTEHSDESWPKLSYLDDDENEVTVIDGTIFWDYMIEHFPTFRFFDPGAYMSIKSDSEYELTNAFLDFRACWTDFIATHPEYARLAKMLDRTDYDPLENYDRKEDGGWKDTTDDDATHSMSYAEQNTTTINDPKIKTKTTGSVYADDSSTANPDTESITEPVRTAATDVDTVKTTNDAHIDTSYVEGDLVVSREFQDYRVHGNIGVTQVSQMLESEVRVREKYNIIVRVLESFAKKVLTLQREVRI